MASKQGTIKYRIAEVQSRHYHAKPTSTSTFPLHYYSLTMMSPVTYPTETTQQVNRTNHVNPLIKAEQPKLVNDSNQHQAEKHVGLDLY
jgi:hypothetical protein